MLKDLNDWLGNKGNLGPHQVLAVKEVMLVPAAFIVERTLVSLLRCAFARSRASGQDDVTRYRFLRNALRTIVGIEALIAIIWTIPSIRAFAVTRFAGAGIIAALIGLSAQKA